MKFTEYLEETIKAGYKNEELWLDYLKDKYSKVDVEKYIGNKVTAKFYERTINNIPFHANVVGLRNYEK